MHDIPLVLTFTVGLAVAVVFGYVTYRLGMSSIVGYLFAGIAIGLLPRGQYSNQDVAGQYAEIGVILLMFGVGLHFHLKELLAVRRVALPGAVIQSIVATVIGVLTFQAFGWDLSSGFIFGIALSVASTVVLMRILADANDLHTRAGHIAVGWLVVEDLFTVVVLVILPAALGAAGAGDAAAAAAEHAGDGAKMGVGAALGMAALKIGALVLITFLLGQRAIPWLLKQVAATKSRELFTLSVLVIALGLAVGSAQFFGVSMALGAFLGGMVVGRSDFSLRAAADALPMRDAFAVVFFVSIGMLFDPRYLVEEPVLIAATLGIVMICKPLTALVLVAVLGYPVRIALSVAVALAQIGEFSFILAKLGNDLHVFPQAGTNALIAVSIVSITLNPMLYRCVGPLEKWLQGRPALWKLLNARAQRRGAAADGEAAAAHGEPAHALDRAHKAVIVGYGPVGQTVARLLRQNDVQPTVIELNLDTVQRLRKEGIAAVYGDATHRDTLTAAGVADVGTFILSAASSHASEEVIRVVRELNPSVRILARVEFATEIPAVQRAGADRVFAGEAEVALSVTINILRELGATPDQIDRERTRVRAELAGDG